MTTIFPADTMSRNQFAGKCAAEVEAHWHRPEYRNAFLLALGTYIENMIVAHQDEWAALVSDASKKTVEKARRSVVKAYLAEVSKEVTDDHGHKHDQSGRFTGPGRSGGRSRTTLLDDKPGKPLDIEQAVRLGRTINAYGMFGEGGTGTLHNQQMKFTIEDKKGNQREFVSHDGSLPDLKGNERVVSYKPLGIPQATTVGGHSFNLLQSLGVPTAGAVAGGGVADTIQQMARDKGDHYDKVRAASQLFVKLGGAGVVPPPLAAAGAFGMYVADHGSEVGEVLGPHLRRLTYKYHGMAATPEQVSLAARRGIQPDEAVESYEHRLALALASGQKDSGLRAIATPAQAALLLATGGTAPSQGFILNRAGKVTQQAVGASDDHYVPFNLRHLHDLHGGSYVRSRTFGGLTTEDLGLALRTGAKRATVISNHGVFTIEFENRTNSLRGRFGDVPPRVINRYGRLLDAIKAGQVKDPANQTALSLNGNGYRVAMNALKQQFPLLIKSVKYTKPNEIVGLKQAGAQDMEDSGYIRPMHLKPSEAVAGYYDTALLDANMEAGAKYDDLDNYKFGKARLYAENRRQAQTAQDAVEAKRKAQREADDLARKASQPTFGQREQNRDAAKGGQPLVPTNLTPEQRVVAEAGGGQQRSVTLEEREKDPLSPTDLGNLLRWARTHLEHADPKDPQAKELLDMFEADRLEGVKDPNKRPNPDHLAAFKAMEASIAVYPGARDQFITDIEEAFRSGPHNMEFVLPPGKEGEDAFIPSEASDKLIVGDTDRRDYDNLVRYQQLRARHNQSLNAGGAGLKGPDLEELKKHEAFFAQPDEDYEPEEGQEVPSLLQTWTQFKYPHLGGLTYKQHIENKLAMERGEKPPHKTVVAPATVADDTPPEEAAKLISTYADQEAREAEALSRGAAEGDDYAEEFMQGEEPNDEAMQRLMDMERRFEENQKKRRDK